MKTLALLLASLWIATVRADVDISREEAATIKSMDLEQVEKQGHALEGKIVKLKFNYRSPAAEKTDDGGLAGRLHIWRYSTGAAGSNYKSGDIDVTLPPAGVAWFTKIPTNESKGSLIVIARIVNSKDGGLGAELLGREIKTDTKGSHIVW